MSTTQVEIRKPHLSPTALSAYEICGRRGQFYHDPDIPRSTTQGLAKGSAWHWGMETFNRARMYYGDHVVGLIDKAELAERLEAIMVGYLMETMGREDYETRDDDEPLDVLVGQLWTMITSWMSEPSNMWMGDEVKIEAIEQVVHVEFGSDHHQFRGYLDAVYRVPEYGVVGVDYKTAGRAWAHQKDGHGKGDGDPRKLPSGPLYAEGWLREYGEEMDWFAFDVMTVAGKFERVWVDVRAEIRKTFVDRWVDTSNMIELHRAAGMDMPTNPSAILCSPKWCAFWTYCPMGEGLDKIGEKK